VLKGLVLWELARLSSGIRQHVQAIVIQLFASNVHPFFPNPESLRNHHHHHPKPPQPKQPGLGLTALGLAPNLGLENTALALGLERSVRETLGGTLPLGDGGGAVLSHGGPVPPALPCCWW